MSRAREEKRVILVTGANRGIGFAIVKKLAQHVELSSATILLGCRALKMGETAIDELRARGLLNIESIQLDVTSDDSVRRVVEVIQHKYGHLDVLVNNAGYAALPAVDFTDLRQIYQDVYNVNVTSVAVLTRLLLPLLRQSHNGGRVIQVGSARGSMYLNATGALPPTASAAYSVSKAALNMLTLDMARDPENKGVEFQVASPGHCKTAFNNHKGTRDPEEGANVVVELVLGARRETKIWETIGSSSELKVVPW